MFLVVGVAGFFELRPSQFALFPTRLGGKAREEGRTVMPTNKSHYSPQAILSDPPRPLGEPTPCRVETRETFPPRAKEKRGLSQDDRDLPLLRQRTPNSLKGFLPSSFTPLAFSSGIKDEGRHDLSKETRELCNFMNGEEKVGQKREEEKLSRPTLSSLSLSRWMKRQTAQLLANGEF